MMCASSNAAEKEAAWAEWKNYRLSLEVVGHNSNAFAQNNRLDQEKVHENSAISDVRKTLEYRVNCNNPRSLILKFMTKNTINVEQVIGRINVIAPQFIREEDENSVDPPQSVQRGLTELEDIEVVIQQTSAPERDSVVYLYTSLPIPFRPCHLVLQLVDYFSKKLKAQEIAKFLDTLGRINPHKIIRSVVRQHCDINMLGNIRCVMARKWFNQLDFVSSEIVKYKINGEEVERLKSHGPLTFLEVHNVGLMVPVDRPKASL
ncbi:protein kinase superfamily protein [Artemisia annua]|uniref:Protein kinase superfamily protein n=1 Tax=Artemisia annua TaxID=35608 RepID=A0A2U1KDG7_ARTAN|nr:protein kinase superfamily protein [Artemisia annua]